MTRLPAGRARQRRARLGTAVAALVLLTAVPAHGLPEGIFGFSGQLGTTCNLSTCHGGGTAPVVRFEGPQNLAAGAIATFRFVVESRSPVQTVAGFNVAASAGSLEVSSQDQQVMQGELTHTAPKANVDGVAAWEFTWQAPDHGGTHTLFGAGLSANGDGTDGGDLAAATTLLINVTADHSPTPTGPTATPTPLPATPTATPTGIAPVSPSGPFRGDANCDGALSAADLTAALLLGSSGQTSACGMGDMNCNETVEPSDLAGILRDLFTPLPLSTCVEWATLGRTQDRTYFNEHETRITRANAGRLRFKWRYLTGAIVTASPSVAWIDVPGEGRIKVVVVPSWDGNVYALRASNGSRLWSFTMKPHPGGAFPFAASAEVTTVAGEQRVYVAGGMTVYCLEAATGALRWEFDAGTGCTTCDRFTERNEIESSPTVAGNLVYFAMDVNDNAPGKGGVYGVDATHGHLVWYFDMATQATCRPLPGDDVRRFDGFHSAAELGLPGDFFATRPGCDFDRSSNACGNIWSSFAVDYQRRLIYTASSNCDTDDNPNTAAPPPPMPPYDEAIFAMTFDGEPAWVWRPREVDNFDLSFGGVPNLFTTEIGGVARAVMGVGGKDGFYYLLDRDGTNAITGLVEPYWRTPTVPGGPIGGIIASAAVGDGNIFFTTAIGISLAAPQQPAAWSLRARDGAVRWSRSAPPSYAPTTAIPGLAFMGGIATNLIVRDADTGDRLREIGLGGPVASAAAVVDGEIFVGAGVGGRDAVPEDEEYRSSWIPSYISALCVPDDPACPPALCNDGNPCTYDYHVAAGVCRSEPAPEGLPCRPANPRAVCVAGVCREPLGAGARPLGVTTP